MSKFSSPLAEELYDSTLDSGQDDDLGESDSFGWFALFREEGAILSVDSQGFVGVALPSDLDFSWSELEKQWGWFQLSGLSESCDGLFLILDTARHSGYVPDFDEVCQHIDSCADCQAAGNFLDE